ncbi:MAG: hypothetical protein KF715_15710 [Candidatus Didemnitutus sp.]|nr:hypothetical protein [Candidatus Didemnitutus sp.]
MKIALTAVALFATAASTEARYFTDPTKDHQILDPIMAPDLRLRLPDGRLRPDLSTGAAEREPMTIEAPALRTPRRPGPRPWNLPDPKPITPQGDGEFPAMHIAPKPDILRLAPMPIAKGVFVPPRMPMVTPDPAVDYKLHVLQLPAEIPTK